MTPAKPTLTRELFDNLMEAPVKYYSEFQALSDSEKAIVNMGGNLRVQKSHAEFYNSQSNPSAWWKETGKDLCAKKIQTYTRLIEEFFTTDKTPTS